MQKDQNKVVERVVVRGVGDVGSAIAWMLKRTGYGVVLHDEREPRTIRRRMAFCDALWDGETELDGIAAYRVSVLSSVSSMMHSEGAIPLYIGNFDDLVESVSPGLVIDGRVRKFAEPDRIRGIAPYTIGVGPQFEAGVHVDAVIESCWGDELGTVITSGKAIEPVPVPPRLNGSGWERFVQACRGGIFQSRKQIGDYVTPGMKIGQIHDDDVLAPIEGHIRGLLCSGLSVLNGEKICEIDPRGEDAHFIGLAERPAKIAEGVLQALKQL